MEIEHEIINKVIINTATNIGEKTQTLRISHKKWESNYCQFCIKEEK